MNVVLRLLCVAASPRGLGVLAAACAFHVSGARAQDRPLHVSRFTVDDGLSQNYTSAVAQDEAGFVWVGTPRGLQRFDGYSFVPYLSIDPDAPGELAGSITEIRVDERGRLWITTPQATFWGRPGLEPLRRIALGSTTAPDSAGRLWFIAGPGQLGSVDWHSESPRVATTVSDTLPACCAAMATAASGESLWFAPNAAVGGMIRVDRATGRLRSYSLEVVTEVMAATEDADGRLWVAGSGGVEVLDRGADRFRSLPAFHGRHAGDVRPDGHGGFLIPTERWLARVDPAGGIIERWAPREAFGDSPLLSRRLMIDREGGFWLTTLAAGLLRFDPSPPIFEHVSSTSIRSDQPVDDFVMTLHETGDETLWVGTMGGDAYRLDAGWSAVEHRSYEQGRQSGIPTETIWALEKDDAGSLWAGSSRGLCMLAPPGACFATSPAAAVADVTAADGWLWVALGDHGIASFDPVSKRFETAIPVGSWNIAIYADPASDDVWIGGSELHRVRVANGRVLEPPQPIAADVHAGDPVFEIRRDTRGLLWLATQRGLQRWDSVRQSFFVVDTPELRGTTVFSIADDGTGRLWLGTSHGLVEYTPATGLSRRFRRQDGILSGEFSRRAALRRRNGELVFGGVDGLTVFRPERVSEPRAGAPIVFTRWQKVTSEGPTEGFISDHSTMRLGPTDRAFTIEFAALAFAAGPARRYRYRLEGLGPAWIETTDHAVTYPTPRPGRYALRVQLASGSDGNWSEPGSVLHLLVVPTIWGTTWFRTLMVLAFLLGLWILHRLRLRQAVATERLRLQISRDLHDEIGAGLSGIALLSDAVSGNGVIGVSERAHLERIARSARGMVADLRDIVWAIDPDGDRLHDVVARMQDVAADLLRDVSVSFHAPPAAELSGRIGMAERRNLLLIYKEILHNIARHANADCIDIRITAHADTVVLTISDDGDGFDPASIRPGTGLRSMRERAARIGGRIELDSRLMEGTTVRLTVRRT